MEIFTRACRAPTWAGWAASASADWSSIAFLLGSPDCFHVAVVRKGGGGGAQQTLKKQTNDFTCVTKNK